MLDAIEQAAVERAEPRGRSQLELFGAFLAELSTHKRNEATHHVVGRDGREYRGTWDDIVGQMRDASTVPARSLGEFMQSEARRGFALTGLLISTADAESFIHGSADAGLLRILR